MNNFAIIPATVRYDKRLKPNEKLLYGEITSMLNSDNKCVVTNDYLARLYDVNTHTISAWVSHLNKLNYIRLEFKDTPTGVERIISIQR